MQFSGLNPWLSMWTQPRATIRSIVQENPRYGVYVLASVYALQQLFYFANFYSMGLGAKPYAIFIAIIVLSPFIGFLWLYYSGWVFHFTGRWFGGMAPAAHVRAALAWAQEPLLLSVMMWLILLMANSETVFIQSATGTSLVFVNIITFILGIWSFVLLIQSIREIQGFSVLRSIASVLVSSLISFLIFFGGFLILGLLLGLSVR